MTEEAVLRHALEVIFLTVAGGGLGAGGAHIYHRRNGKTNGDPPNHTNWAQINTSLAAVAGRLKDVAHSLDKVAGLLYDQAVVLARIEERTQGCREQRGERPPA